MSFPSDLGMTLLFLLVIVGLVVVGFIMLAVNVLNNDQITYSVDFVSIASKPFLLAEVLMNAQLGDRSFSEQAIESVVTGSLEKAGAAGLVSNVKTFVKSYNLKNYKITVSKNGSEIMGSDGAGNKCGDRLDGWCTGSPGCDVGYIEIDGVCKGSDVCCKYNPPQYEIDGNRRGKYPVVSCARNSGLCSEGTEVTIWVKTGSIPYPVKIGPICGEGQFALQELESGDCKNSDAKTRICCGQVTTNATTPLINKAVVPLLYRNEIIGQLEVEAA
jgi:hypothetical protein